MSFCFLAAFVDTVKNNEIYSTIFVCAGYTPSAFVIPGSELEVPDQSKFQADGFFSVSSSYGSTCAGAETVSVAANTCIVDGVFSYKLQLVKGKKYFVTLKRGLH